VARFQLRYHYHWKQNLYWMAAVNVGGAWADWEKVRDEWDRIYWGGGFGLGWATPLGPLDVVLGFGEAGRVQLYVNFAYGF
jgi:outer membrane translocation and assembly module TamA